MMAGGPFVDRGDASLSADIDSFTDADAYERNIGRWIGARLRGRSVRCIRRAPALTTV
jgi:hypothetical protein